MLGEFISLLIVVKKRFINGIHCINLEDEKEVGDFYINFIIRNYAVFVCNGISSFSGE